jgi:DNA processing protein
MNLPDVSIINDKEKLACLRLIRSENIGTKTFYALMKYYGKGTIALERFLELPSIKNKAIKLISEADITDELEKIEKIGAKLIFYKDHNYPRLLKITHDAPPFLTILGRAELLEEETIAVVGSRNASINGTSFAKKIAEELSKSNLIIVSGLARGIDTAAHKDGIGGGTIAVIAGGIDNIYPAENEFLYKEIAEKGLLVAENPFGMVPIANSFPQRNRIISGLSVATIVIEASLKSGSLITARLAAEQGRNVFAVPGFPLDYRYSGTNYLLKQGAILIESYQDVLDHLQYNLTKQFNHNQYSSDDKDSSQNETYIEEDVAQIQELILSSISFAPTSIDDLMIQHNLSIDIVQIAILELELEGKVIKGNNNTITLMS